MSEIGMQIQVAEVEARGRMFHSRDPVACGACVCEALGPFSEVTQASRWANEVLDVTYPTAFDVALSLAMSEPSELLP